MDLLQFYPTGERTAALMWAKFKRPVRHVCDPSAGKGHLIRYAQQGFPNLRDDEIPWITELDDACDSLTPDRFRQLSRFKFGHIKETSVIEVNAEFHPALKELGAKVLGYDFLEVRSLATATSVLLNPPFRAGCAHLLHAWDCLFDGEIVGIINAESIRNPYTQERQRLLSLIEQHGSVEFLRDQFVDEVERKTDVEVALVYFDKVPGKYLNVDSLLGDLARGDSGLTDLDPEVCTALSLPGNFIEDTCFRFRQAVQAARNASESAAIADHLSTAIGLSLEEMQSKGVGTDFREVASSIRDAANADFRERYAKLKRQAWGQVLRSSLLNQKLSNQARKRLEASAEDIYDLDFSPANIHGLFAGVLNSLEDIFKDMMLQLFDTIIGKSNENVAYYKSYRSSEKHRIGMRLRKTRFILPRMRPGFNSVDYEAQGILGDIDKCFHYLHGATGEYGGLVDSIRKNGIKSGVRYETRYFGFRWHAGVQTIHVYANSPEVMDRLNRFVGKLRNWLPGDMDEANADFKKQYEKAESFTDEYLAAYRKGRFSSIGECEIAYRAVRLAQGNSQDEDAYTLTRLAAAIDEVHEQHGLVVGPSLKSSPPSKGIGQSPQALAKSHEAVPQQQLLLAA